MGPFGKPYFPTSRTGQYQQFDHIPLKRMMAFATFADQRDDLLRGKESLTHLSKLD
jgi:hypothetical protein